MAYEKPEILASFDEEEIITVATTCVLYTLAPCPPDYAK